MKTATNLLFLFLVLLISACNLFQNDAAPLFQESINIGKNQISCDYGFDFGNIIEILGDEIFISGNGTMRVFQYQPDNITLKQTFEYGKKTSGVQSIVGRDHQIVVGVASENGTGRVYIYEKETDGWKLKQTLTQDIASDNFGSAIDFDDQWMVIGANNQGLFNSSYGNAYIYSYKNGSWIYNQKLSAQTPDGFGRFGETVALYKNKIMVGGASGFNQNYELNNEIWELVNVDTLQWNKIAHEQNFFLTAADDLSYHAWYLNEDGTKDFIKESNDFDNLASPLVGEVCEIKGDQVLLIGRDVFQGYLFKLQNSALTFVETINQPIGQSIQFTGLAIGDHFIALGGYNQSSRDGKENGIVIIKPL
jgi:hypothetical protein